MSRVAKKPVTIPQGLTINIGAGEITVKGSKGTLHMNVPKVVNIVHQENVINVSPNDDTAQANALAGAMRAIVSNMVEGVSKGYEKKLELVGVGYRAQAQGKQLNLTLGFSHPVAFPVPEGITIETPSQTEILIKGANKQLIGEVAARIRAYRPPEPYKGKGVRFAGERIILKETKKK